MASRNQREGRFVPGWCYNPAFKLVNTKDGTELVPKTRAGQHYNLIRVRGYNDQGHVLPGVTYVRYSR